MSDHESKKKTPTKSKPKTPSSGRPKTPTKVLSPVMSEGSPRVGREDPTSPRRFSAEAIDSWRREDEERLSRTAKNSRPIQLQTTYTGGPLDSPSQYTKRGLAVGPLVGLTGKALIARARETFKRDGTSFWPGGLLHSPYLKYEELARDWVKSAAPVKYYIEGCVHVVGIRDVFMQTNVPLFLAPGASISSGPPSSEGKMTTSFDAAEHLAWVAGRQHTSLSTYLEQRRSSGVLPSSLDTGFKITSSWASMSAIERGWSSPGVLLSNPSGHISLRDLEPYVSGYSIYIAPECEIDELEPIEGTVVSTKRPVLDTYWNRFLHGSAKSAGFIADNTMLTVTLTLASALGSVFISPWLAFALLIPGVSNAIKAFKNGWQSCLPLLFVLAGASASVWLIWSREDDVPKSKRKQRKEAFIKRNISPMSTRIAALSIVASMILAIFESFGYLKDLLNISTYWRIFETFTSVLAITRQDLSLVEVQSKESQIRRYREAIGRGADRAEAYDKATKGVPDDAKVDIRECALGEDLTSQVKDATKGETWKIVLAVVILGTLLFLMLAYKYSLPSKMKTWWKGETPAQKRIKLIKSRSRRKEAGSDSDSSSESDGSSESEDDRSVEADTDTLTDEEYEAWLHKSGTDKALERIKPVSKKVIKEQLKRLSTWLDSRPVEKKEGRARKNWREFYDEDRNVRDEWIEAAGRMVQDSLSEEWDELGYGIYQKGKARGKIQRLLNELSEADAPLPSRVRIVAHQIFEDATNKGLVGIVLRPTKRPKTSLNRFMEESVETLECIFEDKKIDEEKEANITSRAIGTSKMTSQKGCTHTNSCPMHVMSGYEPCNVACGGSGCTHWKNCKSWPRSKPRTEAQSPIPGEEAAVVTAMTNVPNGMGGTSTVLTATEVPNPQQPPPVPPRPTKKPLMKQSESKTSILDEPASEDGCDLKHVQEAATHNPIVQAPKDSEWHKSLLLTKSVSDGSVKTGTAARALNGIVCSEHQIIGVTTFYDGNDIHHKKPLGQIESCEKNKSLDAAYFKVTTDHPALFERKCLGTKGTFTVGEATVLLGGSRMSVGNVTGNGDKIDQCTHNMSTNPGDSGAPIVTGKDGKLVGIHVSAGGVGLNHFTPIAAVNQWVSTLPKGKKPKVAKNSKSRQ